MYVVDFGLNSQDPNTLHFVYFIVLESMLKYCLCNTSFSAGLRITKDTHLPDSAPLPDHLKKRKLSPDNNDC